MSPQKKTNPFDIDQEIVHSLIHGFGMLFGIVGIPILVALAANKRDLRGLVGVAIYGFCFMMLFSFSTLYHGFQHSRIKRVLEVFDHISIYFLIAGTYTPFLLIYLDNSFGITLLSVLWGLTLLGTLFKVFFTGRFETFSLVIYIVMGWMLIVGGKRFFTDLPSNVLLFLIIGGVAYSLGIIFYLRTSFKWHHALWHFMVLLAALCHYVAVLFSV